MSPVDFYMKNILGTGNSDLWEWVVNSTDTILQYGQGGGRALDVFRG